MAPGTGSTGPDDTGRGGTGPGGNGRPRPPAGKPAPKAGKPVPKAGPATGRPARPPSAKPQAAPARAARPAGSKPAPARPQPAKATPPRAAAASSGGKRPVTATTSSSSRRRLPAAALGAGALAIGLVLGVAAYAGWAAVADDDEPTRAAAQVSRASEPSSAEPSSPDPSSAEPSSADPSSGTDGSSTDGSAASTTEPVDDRTERCARAASALAEPLRAARPALDQWDVHVGAMNKLVTGAITLQQANAFWNRTRVGAHDRVKGFQDADKALRRAGVDCPAPAFLGDADPDLRACSRLVADELRVLQVADTAVDTWAVHVHHMEMLREGTMSPEEATRLWLSMWQRGVRQLDAYRAAARDLRSADACPGATGD